MDIKDLCQDVSSLLRRGNYERATAVTREFLATYVGAAVHVIKRLACETMILGMPIDAFFCVRDIDDVALAKSYADVASVAIACGNFDVLSWLVHTAGMIDRPGPHYSILLDLAARHGNVDALEILYEEGVTSGPDFLHPVRELLAACDDRETILRGVDVFLEHDRPRDMWENVVHQCINPPLYVYERILDRHPEFINQPGTFGGSVMYNAVLCANVPLLRMLIARGVDINNGQDPSHALLHASVLMHQSDTTKVLLEFGADINIIDDHGYKPIHNAIRCWNVENIILLLQAGADPFEQHPIRGDPLHIVGYFCRQIGMIRIIQAYLTYSPTPDRAKNVARLARINMAISHFIAYFVYTRFPGLSSPPEAVPPPGSEYVIWCELAPPWSPATHQFYPPRICQQVRAVALGLANRKMPHHLKERLFQYVARRDPGWLWHMGELCAPRAFT